MQDTIPSAPNVQETLELNTRRILSLSDTLDKDPDLHSRAETEPLSVLAGLGVPVPSGVDVRIVRNTEDAYYLVLPPDPNQVLLDEDLSMVAGGKSAGSAASVASAGSFSTALSCASSASSASSAGSASSVG